MTHYAYKLLEEQLSTSEMFKNAYQNLGRSQTRKIEYKGFSYTLQLNPARIKSSTANIAKPLAEENCFLCKHNMPQSQLKKDYDGQFFISINPFPILSCHLTIISHAHTPQTIHGHTERILRLAQYLPGMVVFYNSPKSGASAPFHCHFQAGPAKELPAFAEAEQLKAQYTIKHGNGTYLVKEPTRGMVIIEHEDINAADSMLRQTLLSISQIFGNPEPEANIGACFSNGIYRIIVFPREKHRPAEYYGEDDTRILVSPGFADMAGLVPVSRVIDYERISKENITSIISQVSISEQNLMRIAIK